MTTNETSHKVSHEDTTVINEEDEEEQRAIGMKEVDDEMMEFPPDKDYLEHLPPICSVFRSPILDYEHSCLESRKPRPVSTELSKIEVDPLPNSTTSVIDEDLLKTLSKCLNQLKIKLEYRQKQLENLELIKVYGIHAWQGYVAEYKNMESEFKEELNNLGRRAQELKGNDEVAYENTLEEMEILKKEWDAFIDKNRLLIHEMKNMNPKTDHDLY